MAVGLRQRDVFDAFIGERLQPAIGELGERAFQAPPEIKQFPGHHDTDP